MAGLAGSCGGEGGGPGIGVRRLQDAALLAETDTSRCPLDLDLPKVLGGQVTPRPGQAATGTSVGKAPAGSPLLAVGGASYRCAFDVDGKPVSLVVVAVPEGQQAAAAVGALVSPLQDAGMDRSGAQALVDAAKGAKTGRGVAAGSAAAATASLPGGGAASVALIAGQGEPRAADLADAAEDLAEELAG